MIYQQSLLFGDVNAINPVTWSLEVEVQFYVLAPALAVLFGIRNRLVRRLTIVALSAAVIVARPVLPPGIRHVVDVSLPGYIEFFLTGFLFADVYLVDLEGTASEDPRAGTPGRFSRWALRRRRGEPEGDHRPGLLPPALLLAYLGAFAGRSFQFGVFKPALDRGDR